MLLNWAVTEANIHKQVFPLPHSCGTDDLPNVASLVHTNFCTYVTFTSTLDVLWCHLVQLLLQNSSTLHSVFSETLVSVALLVHQALLYWYLAINEIKI